MPPRFPPSTCLHRVSPDEAGLPRRGASAGQPGRLFDEPAPALVKHEINKAGGFLRIRAEGRGGLPSRTLTGEGPASESRRAGRGTLTRPRVSGSLVPQRLD